MEIQAVRTLDNNTTEVISKSKIFPNKEMVRYFRVPTEKTDEFIKEFEQQQKKMNILGTLGYLIPTLAGGLLLGRLSQKTIPCLLLSFAGGIGTAAATIPLLGKIVGKKQTELLQKYDAKEHTYLGQDGVPEVWNKNSEFSPSI